VREAACQAVARIAPAGVEDVLAGALEDPAASVRFSAAQGLMNLGKVSDKTLAALYARLPDENKGVRQAVAAALAKLDGSEAARRMTDRLKNGAETEAAVRTVLWDSIKALVDRTGSPELARDLGDRFFAREGVEDMQHAAILYEAALAKLPAAEKSSQLGQTLSEKIVDAYVIARMPDSAIPPLRQLIAAVPPENQARLRDLNQQLGQILLAKEPYTDAVPPLVAALKGAEPEQQRVILKDIQSRAETLLKADRPEQALDLLTAFAKAQPDWSNGPTGPALKQLFSQAGTAAVPRAIAKLSGTEEQAAVATATLRKIGAAAGGKLLDALESAAKEKKPDLEARLVAALEAATGRKDHGYDLAAPLEERLKQIAAWRAAM
jgi:hypothetical protein